MPTIECCSRVSRRDSSTSRLCAPADFHRVRSLSSLSSFAPARSAQLVFSAIYHNPTLVRKRTFRRDVVSDCCANLQRTNTNTPTRAKLAVGITNLREFFGIFVEVENKLREKQTNNSNENSSISLLLWVFQAI